jgi:carnitine 3-dehydrogenase
LALTLRVLDHDRKRIHLFHEMFHGATGDLLATAEQMLVHVDARAERSAPLPDDLLERVAMVARAHRTLPVPEVVGRPMGIRRPTTPTSSDPA